MEKSERLCLWCKHLNFEAGSNLSEETWDPGVLKCLKGHWLHAIIGDNPFEYPIMLHEKIQIAKDCPDFQLKDELVKYLSEKSK